MELVIISANTQKVLQLKRMIKELLPKFEIRSLFDFPNFAPLENESSTISERARLKAVQAAAQLLVPCLVEQWTLTVPAIDSTLLFSEHIPRQQQVKMLLKQMQSCHDEQRSAFFESSICWASPEGKVHIASARTEGVIAEHEKGTASVDFDAVFIKHDYQKTMAELPESVRMRVSARRKALEKLSVYLESMH